MALTFYLDLKVPHNTGDNVTIIEGSEIFYLTDTPDNSLGKDGDVAIVVTSYSHYKKEDDVWVLKIDNILPTTGGSNLWYEDKIDLLEAEGSSPNVLATVGTETGNLYLRDNDDARWIVISGNKYEDSNLPDDVNFIIPTGTVIWDITNSKHIYR